MLPRLLLLSRTWLLLSVQVNSQVPMISQAIYNLVTSAVLNDISDPSPLFVQFFPPSFLSLIPLLTQFLQYVEKKTNLEFLDFLSFVRPCIQSIRKSYWPYLYHFSIHQFICTANTPVKQPASISCSHHLISLLIPSLSCSMFQHSSKNILANIRILLIIQYPQIMHKNTFEVFHTLVHV